MNRSPIFSRLIMLLIVGFLCIGLTVALAIWAGTCGDILPDPEALNWGNILLVGIIGGLLCCLIIGIMLLFLGKNLIAGIKDYLSKTDKNGGSKQ